MINLPTAMTRKEEIQEINKAIRCLVELLRRERGKDNKWLIDELNGVRLLNEDEYFKLPELTTVEE